MKTLYKKFNGFSISKKLIVYFITFIIIPLLLVEIIINSVVSQVLNKKTCEINFQVLKQTSNNIENIVNDTERLSLNIIANDGNSQILSNIQMDPNNIEDNKREYKIYVQPLVDLNKYVSSICVSTNGQIIYQKGDLVTKEDTTYFDETAKLKGLPLWTPLYKMPNMVNHNLKKYIISLYRSINSMYEMKQLATERISIDEDIICNSYNYVSVANGGKLFMIDSKGIIISSPDKSILFKNQSNEGFAKKVLKDEGGFFKASIGNINSTVFYYAIKSTGWHVVQIIPESELNKQVTIINLIIIACMGLCTIFGIFFYIFQNNSILKPIKSLTKEMEKVKAGSFDITLKIKNKDEIGELSNSFFEMVYRINELINSVYKGKIREKEAELNALESKINPHFLYNTLDSIRWMAIQEGAPESAKQIELISSFFRQKLSSTKDMVTIKEEIDYLETYILIQRNRYEERIKFHITIDESLLNFKTLKLILQPIVENSLYHGLECKIGGGTIQIKVQRFEKVIKYIVIDDGLGAEEEKVMKIVSGQVAPDKFSVLKNINDRIQLKFGKDYGLSFSSSDLNTKVEVTIPMIEI